MKQFIARRAFVAGGLAAATGVLIGCQTTETAMGPAMPPDEGPDPARPVSLIYISSPACPFCREWERWQEPKWLSSPERAKVTYRVLSFPHFRDITDNAVWPDDLKWVRDRERLTRGTPRYIVVRDERVLISAFGTGRWATDVLPAIQRAVG